MQPIFIASQIQDLLLIKSLTGTNFSTAPIFCQGIEVCEKAIQFGARNLSFYELTWDTVCKMAEIPEIATTLARAFDARHSEIRSRHLNLETSSIGWDYLNIFYITQTVLSTRCTYSRFIETFPKDITPILFNQKNSQDFYFDSGLTRGIIKNLVLTKFHQATSLDICQPEFFKQEANSFSLQIPSGSFKILTHLPTAYYSILFHKNRLRQFPEMEILDMESPYFDIPMTPSRIRLQPVQRGSLPKSFTSYWIELKRLLSDFYESLNASTEAEESGMFDRHCGWAFSQFHAYQALSEAASLSGIERVDMTCHDTGLGGPLLSWANQRDIPVHVWPHSEVINSVMPVLKKGQKHSHISRPTLPLELGVGTSNWVDVKTRSHAPSERRKTLLILLNQLDASGYIPNCRVIELKKCLENFLKHLGEKGWQVKIRHKPSHPYKTLLGLEKVEHADGSLDEWIDWPSFCLSLVSPTTAMIRFWQKGAYCIHLQEPALSLVEKYMLPSQDLTVFHSDKFSELFDRLTRELSLSVA